MYKSKHQTICGKLDMCQLEKLSSLRKGLSSIPSIHQLLIQDSQSLHLAILIKK